MIITYIKIWLAHFLRSGPKKVTFNYNEDTPQKELDDEKVKNREEGIKELVKQWREETGVPFENTMLVEDVSKPGQVTWHMEKKDPKK